MDKEIVCEKYFKIFSTNVEDKNVTKKYRVICSFCGFVNCFRKGKIRYKGNL